MLDSVAVSTVRRHPAGVGFACMALALALPACDRVSGEPEEQEAPVPVGRVTRQEVEQAVPLWVSETVSAGIDEEAATALASVEPGAEVTVLLGTWCSDSRREVPRFWRALDQVGGLVPFTVELIAVDRAKEEPVELLAGRDLRYVPTFIVHREGVEVGRIVESAPGGLEVDLLALLTGEAAGVITGRDDLEE